MSIEYDFEDLGLLDAWQHSNELNEIRNNKTLVVLKELRNYEMHIEYQSRKSHLDVDRSSVKEPIDHDSFFFDPLSWEQFQKLRNIRTQLGGL